MMNDKFMINFKENWELRKQRYELKNKIDELEAEINELDESIIWWSNRFKALERENKELKKYIYNIQRYINEEIVNEINEKYGDILNED